MEDAARASWPGSHPGRLQVADRWGRHGFDGIECGMGGMSGCGHP